ncbi:MAG: DUF2141 domain-containing protein [Pseudomonadales bacterium]
MRSILLGLALACMSCATGPSAPLLQAEEGPHSLRVQITGVRCCDAAVRIGVYRTATDWLKEGRVFKARLLMVPRTQSELTLYGLPAGTYALAAFQDNNDNGRLDRWFGLLPREPVAFSKVSDRRLPPEFDESAVRVPSDALVTLAF